MGAREGGQEEGPEWGQWDPILSSGLHLRVCGRGCEGSGKGGGRKGHAVSEREAPGLARTNRGKALV